MKYFCEEAPEYFIIGVGSLLDIHINKKEFSFPVTKIDFLTIYPMSFEEFLINTNNNILLNRIKENYTTNITLPNTIHNQALELYYYLTVGEMLEVVNENINLNSVINAINYQTNIIESYKNDITQYCETPNASKIIATFNSISERKQKIPV